MSTKPWGTLPVSRIHTIMKSSSEAENIGKDSPRLMTKAAELFIKKLAKESFTLSANGKKLDYKHVAEVVNRDGRYAFIRDIMPKKITIAEYKKILAKENADDDTETTSDESDTESSGSDSQ